MFSSLFQYFDTVFIYEYGAIYFFLLGVGLSVSSPYRVYYDLSWRGFRPYRNFRFYLHLVGLILFVSLTTRALFFVDLINRDDRTFFLSMVFFSSVVVMKIFGGYLFKSFLFVLNPKIIGLNTSVRFSVWLVDLLEKLLFSNLKYIFTPMFFYVPRLGDVFFLRFQHDYFFIKSNDLDNQKKLFTAILKLARLSRIKDLDYAFRFSSGFQNESVDLSRKGRVPLDSVFSNEFVDFLKNYNFDSFRLPVFSNSSFDDVLFREIQWFCLFMLKVETVEADNKGDLESRFGSIFTIWQDHLDLITETAIDEEFLENVSVYRDAIKDHKQYLKILIESNGDESHGDSENFKLMTSKYYQISDLSVESDLFGSLDSLDLLSFSLLVRYFNKHGFVLWSLEILELLINGIKFNDSYSPVEELLIQQYYSTLNRLNVDTLPALGTRGKRDNNMSSAAFDFLSNSVQSFNINRKPD